MRRQVILKMVSGKGESVLLMGTLILLAITAFNLFNVHGLNKAVDVKLDEIKALLAPAQLEIISINVDCKECFSLDSVVSVLKNDPGLNITAEIKLNSSSVEAKKLIEQYGIEKLPTVIVRGDIGKISMQGFEKRADALVFVGQKPPYLDTTTNDVVGLVSAIIIKDESCDVCYDVKNVVDNLKQEGVAFSEVRVLNFDSTEAKGVIARYGIKRVPALLLSEDIDAYQLSDELKRAGIPLRNGYYVLETQPPYVDVENGSVRGLVTLIMINDSNCYDCYDVSIHKDILLRLGLAINSSRVVDVNSKEGQMLVQKYNITKAPTILLTGDLDVYEAFRQIWLQVGTIEKDGTYVFRNMDALQNAVYREL